MVGRHRSKDGIKYPFDIETNNPDKKLHLHIDFDSILKDGYKIIVLNHQPGIGKTYTVMNYIMDKSKQDESFSFFYFTDKHKTIDAHLKRLREDKKIKGKEILETFIHWKGFAKYCENELVEKYLELNLPREIVIKHFGLEDKYKEYEEQFKNTKRVFAPFYYLTDDHFKDNPPNIIFLDESITQIETYIFDKNKIAHDLKSLKAPQEYIENAKQGNKECFLNEDVIKQIKGLYHKRLISTLEKGKKLDKFKLFNPYHLEKYLQWSKIYQYENELYSKPLYYDALDAVVNNIPIVMLDATFNINLFSYFLESYNGEMIQLHGDEHKGFKDLRIKILQSNISNNKTTIFRMHPGGCWTRRSLTEFKDKTWQWLLQDLQELRIIFGDANIGIITFKNLSWLFEAMNFDVEYYGNLRGSNKLENKEVLVIIGAWVPLPPSWVEKDKNSKDEEKNYIDGLVEKYTLRKITKSDVIEVKIGAPFRIERLFPQIYNSKKSKARIRATMDNKFFNYNSLKYKILPDANKFDEFPISVINTIWFDEMYQAFHRNRGLRYPRIIFSYAWFPEPLMLMRIEDNLFVPEPLIEYNLRNEFPSSHDLIDPHKAIEFLEHPIRKIMTEEQKEKLFDTYRMKYKGGVMQKLIKHIELDTDSVDIAGEFSINKKGEKRSRDTIPITELKRAYKKVKDKL